MTFSFAKVEAAGNDFILIPRAPTTPPVPDPAALCARHKGVGADGIIFFWQSKRQWRWKFLNADGTEAAMCGNAARAVTLWLRHKSPRLKSFSWQADRTLVVGRLRKDGGTEVSWEIPDAKRSAETSLKNLVKNLAPQTKTEIHWVDSGVPHLVLVSPQPWPPELRARVSPALRSHASLGPEGANVTFVSQLTPTEFSAVTFERGVEAETQACGSGAMAAFIALEKPKEKISAPLSFQFPGGKLEVRREEKRLWLAGPARVVFEGELVAEDLHK